MSCSVTVSYCCGKLNAFIEETVFGLILSTDCAERSCKISWFQRTEDEVTVLR